MVRRTMQATHSLRQEPESRRQIICDGFVRKCSHENGIFAVALLMISAVVDRLKGQYIGFDNAVDILIIEDDI